MANKAEIGIRFMKHKSDKMSENIEKELISEDVLQRILK